MIKEHFVSLLEENSPVYIDDDIQIYQYISGHKINMIPCKAKKEDNDNIENKNKV